MIKTPKNNRFLEYLVEFDFKKKLHKTNKNFKSHFYVVIFCDPFNIKLLFGIPFRT